MSTHAISVIVNGKTHKRTVDLRLHLADFLRQELGLTGTHIGCEHGVCGACTVLVDGATARSCLMLAVQADGRRVETIESVASPDGTLHPIQAALSQHHGLQCGYCTPGVVMTLVELQRECGSDADQRGRGAPRAVGESVPLHRLSRHRRRGARGAAEGAHQSVMSPEDGIRPGCPKAAADPYIMAADLAIFTQHSFG